MKYRIKPYDIMNDIWILQERVLWIFWEPIGFGPKSDVQTRADELNSFKRGS